MNATLSNAESDALLEVLHRGLIHIRRAAMGGDAEQAEAIADALHNLPRLLSEGDRWRWTIAAFRELFLDGLRDNYPDVWTGLSQPLKDLESRDRV